MSETIINYEDLVVSQSNPVRNIYATPDIKPVNRTRKTFNLKNMDKYNSGRSKKFESDDKKRNSIMKFIIRDRRRYINKLHKELENRKKEEWDKYDIEEYYDYLKDIFQ